jgi:sphingomyelin phosphodiesterase
VIGSGTDFSSNCTKCTAATEVMHLAALTQSASMITDLLIRTCNHFNLTVAASTFELEFSSFGGLGPYWAQLFQKMALETGDMQAFCHYTYSYCAPPVIEIDESMWFSPKPESQKSAPAPSGMHSLYWRYYHHELIDVQEKRLKYYTFPTSSWARGE